MDVASVADIYRNVCSPSYLTLLPAKEGQLVLCLQQPFKHGTADWLSGHILLGALGFCCGIVFIADSRSHFRGEVEKVTPSFPCR